MSIIERGQCKRTARGGHFSEAFVTFCKGVPLCNTYCTSHFLRMKEICEPLFYKALTSWNVSKEERVWSV